MNKEEIKLEKISYEELQDKFISVDTKNYVLEHQNNRLVQENKQLNDNWNKLKEHIQGCLDEVLENDVYDRTSYEQGVIAGLESSLFKLEELENGDSNE